MRLKLVLDSCADSDLRSHVEFHDSFNRHEAHVELLGVLRYTVYVYLPGVLVNRMQIALLSCLRALAERGLSGFSG